MDTRLSSGESSQASPASDDALQNQRREQVSFVVRHQIRAGAAADYETWLRRVMAKATYYPGHLGVQVVRPPEGGRDYVTVVRFASEADARRWASSSERRELVAEVRGLLERGDEVEILSGIDFWFTPETPHQKPPVRWKQWLITTSVIWPLTLIVPPVFAPLFERLPPLGRWGISHGIIAATIVALVIYVVMPRYVKAVSRWLFR